MLADPPIEDIWPTLVMVYGRRVGPPPCPEKDGKRPGESNAVFCSRIAQQRLQL